MVSKNTVPPIKAKIALAISKNKAAKMPIVDVKLFLLFSIFNKNSPYIKKSIKSEFPF